MRGHGERKFTAARLLASSAGLGWSTLAAEVRGHVAGPIPAFVTEHTELTLILRAAGQATVFRAAQGVRQQAVAVPGTTFLIPVGTREEATYLTGDIPGVMHLYLSGRLFEDLADEEHLPRFDAGNIRYASGLRDVSLMWLGKAVNGEMQRQSSAGRLLVETLGLSLAEKIIQSYTGGVASRPAPPVSAGGLGASRLRRVLDYIEDNLTGDVSVKDLASVACLSPYHFARLFRAAVGMAPHAYLSKRRLALAKRLLSQSDCPLAEIALTCGFSSQSNFAKAFKGSTGKAPGAYRKDAR